MDHRQDSGVDIEPRTSLTLDRAVIAGAVFLPLWLAGSVLLAVVGWFSPPAIGGIGLVAAVISGVIAKRHTVAVLTLPSYASAGLIALVVGVIAAFNIVYVAEFMQTNRDPGVYLTTARWLSSEGDLLIHGVTGPFQGLEWLTADWSGYYETRSDGMLYAQFLHGLPVVLATLRWIFGESALFHANTAIFVLSILLVFLLVSQFVRSGVAAFTVSVTAVSVVAFYFARATYSEPLVLLLTVLGLLAFLIGTTTTSRPAILAAGLAIGATALVRIDGWILISGLILALAVVAVVPLERDRPPIQSLSLAIGTPIAVGLIGLVDGLMRSPQYLTDHSRLVVGMLGFVVCAVLVAVGLVVVTANRPHLEGQIRVFLTENGDVIRRVASWAVVAAASALLFLRPIFLIGHGRRLPFIGELLAQEGAVADEFRNLSEMSARWFTWYWGWAGVILAIVGLILVLWLPSRVRRPILLLLIVIGSQFAVYLLRPSITPDQPWAMRRFYVTALILIPLLTAVTVRWMIKTYDAADGRRRTFAGIVFATALAMTVAVPLTVAIPLLDVAPQSGMRASVDGLCSALPPDAAVVVVGEPIDQFFGAAIRTFCEVPTVSSRSGLALEELGNRLRVVEDDGFTPVIVTTASVGLPEWDILAADEFWYPREELVLLRPPGGGQLFEFSWVAALPG
ncbi:MAG: hypothetical protein ABFR53_08740 [Actinomycetota bacterium]